MSAMDVYSFTTEDIEEIADTVKAIVVGALLKDKFISDGTKADEWCKSHTVIVTKKSIFRTISKLWKDTKEIDGFGLVVVKEA